MFTVGLLFRVTPGRIVDMPFFDMSLSAEADRCPDRSFIFYLTFPSDVWVNENINELFSPYGNCCSFFKFVAVVFLKINHFHSIVA